MNSFAYTDPSASRSPPRLPLHRSLGVHLGSLVSGSGLILLLAMCESVQSISFPVMAGAVLLGALIWSIWVGVTRPARAPVWLCLTTSSLDLVISLAVALHLFGRLCPHEGKQFATIPVYFLLCMSRLSVSKVFCRGQWAAWLFVSAFLIAVWADPSGHHRGFDPFHPDDAWSPVPCFIALVLFAVYDGISQWARLSEDLWHFPTQEVMCIRHDEGAGLDPVNNALWSLTRSSLLILNSLTGGGFLWLLLSPHPTYSSPYTPNYFRAFYAGVLIFSCMLDASVWFQCLQRSVELISRRVYNQGRLLRLQHILNALFVASGWAFPLDQKTPSLILRIAACDAVALLAIFA